MTDILRIEVCLTNGKFAEVIVNEEPACESSRSWLNAEVNWPDDLSDKEEEEAINAALRKVRNL